MMDDVELNAYRLWLLHSLAFPLLLRLAGTQQLAEREDSKKIFVTVFAIAVPAATATLEISSGLTKEVKLK